MVRLINLALEVECELRSANNQSRLGFVHESGSPSYKWCANPPFVKRGLGAAERACTARSRLRTVVGANQEEGVVAQIRSCTDVMEEFTELTVHFYQDGKVEAPLAVGPLLHGRSERTRNVVWK